MRRGDTAHGEPSSSSRLLCPHSRLNKALRNINVTIKLLNNFYRNLSIILFARHCDKNGF